MLVAADQHIHISRDAIPGRIRIGGLDSGLPLSGYLADCWVGSGLNLHYV